jgi:DNA polymerase elongation subunit (family B)
LDGKYDKLNGAIFNTSISPKVSESGSYHALTHVIKVNNEIKLFQEFISVVRLYDPDILVGYETETQSIGYICKRAETFTI